MELLNVNFNNSENSWFQKKFNQLENKISTIFTDDYVFKKKYLFEQRAQESSRILNKYPNRVPIIVEKLDNAPNIDKRKYLVPLDFTMGQFLYVIRKRIKMESYEALYIYINNNLVPTANLISNIYNENKDKDGFLYVNYGVENTFGA